MRMQGARRPARRPRDVAAHLIQQHHDRLSTQRNICASKATYRRPAALRPRSPGKHTSEFRARRARRAGCTRRADPRTVPYFTQRQPIGLSARRTVAPAARIAETRCIPQSPQITGLRLSSVCASAISVTCGASLTSPMSRPSSVRANVVLPRCVRDQRDLYVAASTFILGAAVSKRPRSRSSARDQGSTDGERGVDANRLKKSRHVSRRSARRGCRALSGRRR